MNLITKLKPTPPTPENDTHDQTHPVAGRIAIGIRRLHHDESKSRAGRCNKTVATRLGQPVNGACSETVSALLQTNLTAQSCVAIALLNMHPEVVTAIPGKCPKCGMELMEKN